MTPTQPDFVFSDEQDGVVAIKNGDDVLYASLYWRARNAVNFLAKVHYLTPTVEHDATVWETAQLDDSGMKFTRDDRVIEAQTRRHEDNRGDVQQALQGETLPIAKIPAGVKFRPGDESVYAGKADFYTLRYGPYLIALNTTTDRSFDVTVPADMKEAKELVTKQSVTTGQSLSVKPRTTAVIWTAN